MEKIQFDHKQESLYNALGISKKRVEELNKELNEGPSANNPSELLEIMVNTAKTTEELILLCYHAGKMVEKAENPLSQLFK